MSFDFKHLGFELQENGSVTICVSSSTGTKNDKKTSAAIPGQSHRSRLILKDFEEGGIASSVEVEASAFKLSQKLLVDKFSLLSIPHPGDVFAGQVQPLLTTPGWETASRLIVVVPSERMPPGVWSTQVALIVGTKQASADKLLSEIYHSSNGSSNTTTAATTHVTATDYSATGVLFLNPFIASHLSRGPPSSTGTTSTSSTTTASSSSTGHASAEQLPAQAVLHAATANLRLCWDKLLAAHPSKKLFFVTHGEGASVLLSLLGDRERGLRARERTKAVAFLAPPALPKTLLVDVFGQENPTLVDLISNRSATWMAQIRPSHGLSPSSVPLNEDGTQPLEIRPVLFGPEFDAPNFEAGAGGIVTHVGLSIPGTAALRDEALVVASGFVPHFASQHVVSFLTHMQGDKASSSSSVPTAAEWAAEEKKAEERKELQEIKKEEEKREAEKEAAAIAAAKKAASEAKKKAAEDEAAAAAAKKASELKTTTATSTTTAVAPKPEAAVAPKPEAAAPPKPEAAVAASSEKKVSKAVEESVKETSKKPESSTAAPVVSAETPTSPKQPAPVTKSRARLMMEASAAAVASPSASPSSSIPPPPSSSSSSSAPTTTTAAAAATTPATSEAASKKSEASHGVPSSPKPQTQKTPSAPAAPQQASSAAPETAKDSAAPVSPAPVAAQTKSETSSVSSSTTSSPFTGLVAPFEKAMSGGFERLKFLHASGEGEWVSTGLSSGVSTFVMSPTASRPADIPASEPIVGARGDSILPFPAAALMHLLSRDEKSSYELDPTIDKKILVEEIVPDLCRLEHMKYKGVAMTDPRDFAVASGGVVDAKDGKAYLFSTSLEHEKVPKAKGFVRGRLEVGAWVIEPIASSKAYDNLAKKLGLPAYPKLPENEFLGACRVSYLFRLSIGGSLPKFLVQQISAAQAKTPSLVSKLLESRYPITSPKGRTALKSAIASLPTNMASFGAPEAPAPAASTAAAASTTTAPDTTHSSTGAHAAAATPVKDAKTDQHHHDAADHAGHGDHADKHADKHAGDHAAHAVSDDHGKNAQHSWAEVSFDMTGTWRVDKATSETLDELLKEMGVPWIARKVVDGLEVTTVLRQAGSSDLFMEEKSRLGDHASKLSLNWKQYDVKGGDGKVVKVQAIAIPSVDMLEPTADAIAAVDALLKKEESNVKSNVKFGPGSGCIVSTSILPDNLGITFDQRHLVKPNLLRLITVYVKEGKVKAKLTRYLHRLNPETLQVLPQIDAPVAAMPKPTSAVPLVSSPSATSTSTVDKTATAVAALPSSSPSPVVIDPTAARAASVSSPASVAPAAPSTSQTAGVDSPARPQQTVTSDPTSPRPVSSSSIDPSSSPSPALSSSSSSNRHHPNVPIHPEGWSHARWIPDEKVTKCETCKLSFNGLRRMHHCRSCGLAFCGSCSPSKLPLSHFSAEARKKAGIKDKEPVRVCVPCAAPFVHSTTTCGSAGGKITLTGGNLGERGSHVQIKIATQFSKAVAIKVDPTWESGKEHTSLTFSMPPGVGKREIYLTVDDRVLVGHIEFFYDPIELTSVDLIESDGGVCILRGKNLPGTNVVDLRSLEVRMNGHLCPVLRCFERYSAIEINAPAGTGGVDAGNVITVAVTGCPGKKPATLPFSYAPPHIFAVRLVEVKPLSTKLSDDDDLKVNPCIVLYGASFGETAVNISLTINGDQCEDVVLLVPHSKVRATVPKSVLKKAVSGDELVVTATVRGVKGETIKTNFV